jgi:hypothetical protein
MLQLHVSTQVDVCPLSGDGVRLEAEERKNSGGVAPGEGWLANQTPW